MFLVRINYNIIFSVLINILDILTFYHGNSVITNKKGSSGEMLQMHRSEDLVVSSYGKMFKPSEHVFSTFYRSF